jgi:ABC-type uncharacterized transport system permease subunit
MSAEDFRMASSSGRDLGMLVFAVWLILTGVTGLISLGLPSILMSVLALVAGVLIISGR